METANTNIVNEEPKPGTKAFLEAELEAAKAELEALKAQAEKDAAANAETVAPVEERVDLFVPKGYANDEPNMTIAVNGVNYVLMLVKHYVYYVINSADISCLFNILSYRIAF